MTETLNFKLEAIASGWIVRVYPRSVARAEHDYAELATPPYQSVTPLAISTDYSFRAQDALAWNPRRFHIVMDAKEYAELLALYPAVLKGDAHAETRLAEITNGLPEATLTILDAHLVPGTNDQWKMAAAVASHLEKTPHVADAGAPTPLGRINSLRFRVEVELPPGVKVAKGIKTVSVMRGGCLPTGAAQRP